MLKQQICLPSETGTVAHKPYKGLRRLNASGPQEHLWNSLICLNRLGPPWTSLDPPLLSPSFNIRIASWIAREPRKKQKEGQKEQGTFE